jgi:hypothetical protein
MWAEDNPSIIEIVLEQQKIAKEKFASNPELAWKENALMIYKDKIDCMSIDELKMEIKACQKKVMESTTTTNENTNTNIST